MKIPLLRISLFPTQNPNKLFKKLKLRRRDGTIVTSVHLLGLIESHRYTGRPGVLVNLSQVEDSDRLRYEFI